MPRVRPLKALTVAAFSVALVGIVANAMVLQRGRHPAPLFGLGQSVDGQPDAAQRASAAVVPPRPTPAPVERTGTIAPAPPTAPAPNTEPTPAPVSRREPLRRATVKSHREDGIGGLLKTQSATAEAHYRPGHPSAKAAKTADLVPTTGHAVSSAKPAAEKPLSHTKQRVKPEGGATVGTDHHVKAEIVPASRSLRHPAKVATATKASAAKKVATTE